MSRFAMRYPYLIIVLCLITCVVGVTSLVRMPVDLFPTIRIPVVVVATFYSGMPPEQIENDITGRFERFFTLGSGIDHIESRSLPGVSLIKVYFQPGTNPDSAVTTIANLAMANLRRLPPGTLPPVVLKFDASSLPVCLITLKGEGMSETELRDLGQYTVRNQVANVPGASVPQPFGGRYRQIMVYVDPAQAGGPPAERDGRGAGGERLEPDLAGRRRADRAVRLQHLRQQPVRDMTGHQPAAAQDGRRRLRAGGATSARRRTPRRFRQRWCGWTASARSICPCSSRAASQHHRRGERHQRRRRPPAGRARSNW